MNLKNHLLVSFFVGAVLSLAFILGIFSHAQTALQDTLYDAPIDPRIVIVAIDDASIQHIGRWPWNRSAYAELLPKLANAKAVGIDIVFSEQSAAADDRALADALEPHTVLAAEYTAFEQGPQGLIGTKPLLPLPELREKAPYGMVNLITDKDGKVRSTNTALAEPLFAEKIAELAGAKIQAENTRYLFTFSDTARYPSIPFIDALRGDYTFAGKIVLIGATAPDLHDYHLTPVGKMSGVEIQANLIASILAGRSWRHESRLIAVIVIVLASLAVGFLFTRLNAWIAGLAALGLAFAYLVIAVLFSSSYILLDLVFAPLSLISSYVANLTHHYLLERKQKQYIHDAFSRYVAPEVVSQLVKHPEKLSLGGERREITIFFSDVRGFTTFSEALSPEKLVHLLNEYLTAMTDIIMDHGGVVDKYIGDAIMAFWGAPLEQPDHAVRAANATIAMNERLKQLQKKWKEEGYPLVEIGCGLNTGPAVIGNMGSDKRFNYTAMGDTINLGSRLEGITKEYGVKTIISESTQKQLDETFFVRELDLVRVKGKKEPIRIFELIGKIDTVNLKQKEMIGHFAAGLANYRAKKFKDAILDFAKSAREGDRASELYIARCEHFIKEHPGNEWDCVWVMKTK
ncbi:adenylate/guanylate cyclase domain-containing protein [Candidatus Woesearchaeota archaeon]|nr:MAG: adenylate/guanylate cyclase domain-containing protein [Candidatus Woesearchaeota archaeon]